MDIAADVASELGVHTKQAGTQAIGGFKDFFGEFAGQLTGSKKVPTEEEVAASKVADDESSNQEYLQLRNQVAEIYRESRAESARKEQMRRQQEVQQTEEKKLEELNTKRAMRRDVAVAIGKSSAETGKSYGAE